MIEQTQCSSSVSARSRFVFPRRGNPGRCPVVFSPRGEKEWETVKKENTFYAVQTVAIFWRPMGRLDASLPFIVGLHVKICLRTWGVVTWENLLLSVPRFLSFSLSLFCRSESVPSHRSHASPFLRHSLTRSVSFFIFDVTVSRLFMMMKWPFSCWLLLSYLFLSFFLSLFLFFYIICVILYEIPWGKSLYALF